MREHDWSIREASVSDSPEILSCLSEAFAPYRSDYSEAGFADTVLSPRSLEERFSEMTILLAVDRAGEVLGTIAYKVANCEGYIRGMAVRPVDQGSGVATALLKEVELRLLRLQCRAIVLKTTSPLLRAIAFYERNGFSRLETEGSFFGMEIFTYRKEIRST